ncbi:putative transposase [Trichonephila clavipes]|nr:putative transposase [Trichonephila clavipes]
MKAVSVLEHFSDHGSIHQKMKKNTTSVRSYPNSAGDGKTPYEEGLVFHLKLLQGNSRDARGHQLEDTLQVDFHKRILFSDEAHFWLNGYVNKQNCRIWSEANPQVYAETPLHPEKLTVWCALWAGGILLQKR